MQNQNNNNVINELLIIINQLYQLALFLLHRTARLFRELDEMDTQLEEEKLNREIAEWRLNVVMEESVNELIEERDELRIQVNELQFENTRQFREIFWLKSLCLQNDDDIIETQSLR